MRITRRIKHDGRLEVALTFESRRHAWQHAGLAGFAVIAALLVAYALGAA